MKMTIIYIFAILVGYLVSTLIAFILLFMVGLMGPIPESYNNTWIWGVIIFIVSFILKNN